MRRLSLAGDEVGLAWSCLHAPLLTALHMSTLRNLQEGFFDPAGAYIEYERQDEQDGWLDSIEGEQAALVLCCGSFDAGVLHPLVHIMHVCAHSTNLRLHGQVLCIANESCMYAPAHLPPISLQSPHPQTRCTAQGRTGAGTCLMPTSQSQSLRRSRGGRCCLLCASCWTCCR